MKYSLRGLPGARIVAAAAILAIAGAGASAQDQTQQETTAQQETPVPADPNAVVATINGEPVTEGDLTVAIADLGEQFAQLPEDQRRAAALSAIIEIRLLSKEAEAAGLADS
jgi:peptidyl-prolyl cis-trans isomerase C